MKHHLYISPHLDDAVYSCGGCILQQTARGDRVTVLTVFAGDPPPGPLSSFANGLHSRWGTDHDGVAVRRAEDRMACARLDATAVHLEFPEAIYRMGSEEDYLYTSEEAIFGRVHPAEQERLALVLASIQQHMHESLTVYAPLGLGGHVDHRFIRLIADRMKEPVRYYPDFPYAARCMVLPVDLDMPQAAPVRFPLDQEEVLGWVHAICEYQTQLSTFWKSYDHLLEEVESYVETRQGLLLYLPEYQA
ncbi:MAG: PIG-L family deacetylase [Anaerolineales bacterium]|nr:PIG-L family deacetylase [Anaerolineales bacterium]